MTASSHEAPRPSTPGVPASTDRWGPDGAIHLGASSVELWKNGKRRIEIDFESLRQIGTSKQRGGTLILSTPHAAFFIDAQQLGGAHQLAAFREALQRRLLDHPKADHIQQTLARSIELDRIISNRVPQWSYFFIVVCAVIFVGQVLTNATLPGSSDGLTGGDGHIRLTRLIAWGANAPALVADGEYFRLVTANFMHGGPVHFAFNIVGLWVVGRLVERIWGPWRFVILFLLTAVAGAAASTWITMPPLSLGVSTSLVGLVAAYFVIWLRFGSVLPPDYVVSSSSWLLLVVVNGAIWAFTPGIDHWGHAGGGLAGAFLVMLLHPLGSAPDFRQVGTMGTKVTAWLLLIAVWAAGVWTVVAAIKTPADRSLARVLTTESDRSAAVANNFAWVIVTSPSASAELLEAAKIASERAVENSPDDSIRAHALDTLATAYYRLGRHEAAVDTSLRSVRLDPADVSLSQLSRFLQSYLQKKPARLVGLSRSFDLQVSFEDPQLVLTHKIGMPAVTVVALVLQSDRLEGSLWIRLATAKEGEQRWELPPDALEALRHPQAKVILGLTTTERVTDKKSGGSLKYLTIDSQIRSLP